MSSLLSLNPIVQHCYQSMALDLCQFERDKEQSNAIDLKDRVLLVNGAIHDGSTCNESILLMDGKIEKIGSQWEVERHINELGLRSQVRKVELTRQQCIIPSFVLPKVDVFAGIVAKQWLHLGPFGLQATWQKPMPNYNLNYVSKALCYFEKSLPSHHWVIGYGLDTQMLPYTPIKQYGDEEDYLAFLDNLSLARAICIFDKSGKRALLNSLAATAIYLSFGESERKRFPNIRLFLRFIEMNQGLAPEFFSWLVKVLPQEQMQISIEQGVAIASEFKREALKQGITTIGIDVEPSVMEFAKVALTPIRVYPVTQTKQEKNLAHVSSNVAYPDEIGFDGYRYQRANSDANQKAMFPLKSLVEHETRLVFNCEFPERPLGAIRLITQAVNRVMLTAPGYIEENKRVLNPEQALTVSQALQCVTLNAAQLLEEPGLVGRLCQGAPADFVVLSCNPFDNPHDLEKVEVVQTWINGCVSYSSLDE